MTDQIAPSLATELEKAHLLALSAAEGMARGCGPYLSLEDLRVIYRSLTRAAALAKAAEKVKTCATCRFFRPDTSEEFTAPDGRCCHESEAHPLHWANEVPETFGCNLWEGKGE